MAPPKQTTKKWIDKKSATTFQVRYRSQNDPLIHDETATDFVFTTVDAPNANKTSASTSKVKTTHDLASELGLDGSKIRANEGEAAMHGIYYDDTNYDYMQHLRDMGSTLEAVFIEAPQADTKQRKDRHGGRKTLDEALRDEVIVPKSQVVQLPKELLPSEVEVKRTYQDQQAIPDALSGFQPDMDPRLREVLEALEDEAYVDDNEDIFGELAKGGEITEDIFLDTEFDDVDDDGWGSDTTEKATTTTTTQPLTNGSGEQPQSEDWMREFSKFKKAQKKEKPKEHDDAESSLADTMSFGGSSVLTAGTMSISGRRRRRREKKNGGARTATSGYSMSSSALFRTEGLTLLDDRFDRIEEEYNEDEEEDGMTGPVPEVRKDFDSIMDEFLGGYSMTGQRPSTHRIKRGKYQTGMDQLDEVRKGLGRARIR